MEYGKLVGVYEQLEATTKRLEKTFILSEFLKKVDSDQVVLLVQGRVFPNWDQRELGMAIKLVVKAINTATGAPMERIEQLWKATGDIGVTAEQLVGKKSQVTLFSQGLTVTKVFDNLRKIAELEGEGTVDRKVQLVAELLTSAKPKEAKYVIRTVLQDLRVGLGEGTIRDAIVWAFFPDKIKYNQETKELEISDEERVEYDKHVTLVQEAFDVANDFAEVVRTLKEKGASGLQNISLVPGKPVKVMLYQKALDVAEGFENVGKPAAIEFKYDGFRLQVHKAKGKVVLFTRRLENVTAQFPDVAARVVKFVQGDDFIIDAEVVGIDAKSGKFLPFQDISQRIKRKYDIEDMARKFPVVVFVFDALFYNGRSLLKVPFIERRKVLEEYVRISPDELELAEELITDDEAKAQEFYKRSLAAGNEGAMMKNLQGMYKPGSRVGFGMKVKPTMETLEVVIVGAEWGEGKRGKWLSTFVVAVRDDAGNFVQIGRVGTGIKEKEHLGVSFEQLTQLLLPLVTKEEGREVVIAPKIVIEVDYEEIQKSPTYSSGFALRFPRLVRLREDRLPSDVSTLSTVKMLAEAQRGRSDA